MIGFKRNQELPFVQSTRYINIICNPIQSSLHNNVQAAYVNTEIAAEIAVELAVIACCINLSSTNIKPA